jgi:glutamate racemase
MSAKLPIGIFDSGIGGLTVASAIHRVLPNEELVYFGDTAHLPYGDKSPEAIKYFSLKIAQFLLDKQCKMIVIACNTASSLAYHDLVEFIGDKIPVLNVIDPVVDFVAEEKQLKCVGVIGTKATINSDLYAKKLKLARPGIEVKSLATPLLAPMIEEGFFSNTISNTVIHSYLSSPKLKNIDSLILACTHYPLIQAEIEEFYHEKVTIINSAAIVAQSVQKKLAELNLLSKVDAKKHQFFVSDYTSSFEKSTKLFFGEKIHLKLKNIWS